MNTVELSWIANELDSIFKEDLSDFELKLAEKCIDAGLAEWNEEFDTPTFRKKVKAND